MSRDSFVPRLILHGGLESAAYFARNKADKQKTLRDIAATAYETLRRGSAMDAVVEAVRRLEDCPLFNAGTGAVIQNDGVIRLSAAVMDGATRRFSGVMNIRDIQNPVLLARMLQDVPDRVLSGEEALAYARAQSIAFYNPETPQRRADFLARSTSMPQRSAPDGEKPFSTVGCVALDATGALAAATSTGGKGFEIPGRVSDSATVAGNYANAHAAISCTGIGEDIVSAACAAAIATRAEDGMTLKEACERSVQALHRIGGAAGCIALTPSGEWAATGTHPTLTWAMCDGSVTVFE